MEDQKILLEQLRISAKSRLAAAGPQLRSVGCTFLSPLLLD